MLHNRQAPGLTAAVSRIVSDADKVAMMNVSTDIGRFRRYPGRQAGGLALRDRQPPIAGPSGGLGRAVSQRRAAAPAAAVAVAAAARHLPLQTPAATMKLYFIGLLCCGCLAEFDWTITSDVESQLSIMLTVPWYTLDFEAEVVESGMVLKENYTKIDFHAVDQMLFSGIRAALPSVFMNYIASQEGGFFDGFYNNDTVGYPQYTTERSGSNETCMALNYTSRTASANYRMLAEQQGISAGGHCFLRYLVDQETGLRIEGSDALSHSRYDPRIRPWYISAVDAGERRWSPVYVFELTTAEAVIGITAARPLYAPFTGTLLGVAGLDLVLDSIDTMLASFAPDNTTKLIFIIEKTSTMLIGASVSGVATTTDSATGVLAQQDALSCGVPIIAEAAAAVPSRDALENNDDDESTFLTTVASNWWMHLDSFSDNYGLCWRIVTLQRVDCEPGFENDVSTTSGVCVECEPGYFSTKDGQECSACPDGTIAPSSASAECTACAPNTCVRPCAVSHERRERVYRTPAAPAVGACVVPDRPRG